jgi:NhaP-type Na+/H+ or K+/H+ antiporter
MPQRMAACAALIAFALCLLVGAFGAGNSFSTVILRALVAMAGMYVVGLVLGLMARGMLEENLRDETRKLKKSTKLEPSDR